MNSGRAGFGTVPSRSLLEVVLGIPWVVLISVITSASISACPALGVAGSCLSDDREVGSCDPHFQIPADGNRCLVIPPLDELAVSHELLLECRSHVAPFVRPGHPVPLTYRPRVEQPRVLPREDLLGDARECISGLDGKIVVTRRLRRAVRRLRSGVVDPSLGAR